MPPRRWAQIEVWPNAPYGLYAVQDPAQPEHNLRATLHADGDGNYAFATRKPVSYEVPGDGLEGELVRAGGGHCWRPAHIHILINAEGYKRHISQNFDAADPYINEHSIFGMRAPLAVPYDQTPGKEVFARFAGIEHPFNIVSVDFVLARA